MPPIGYKMATTVTGKLNKAASIFQAGESTGFGLRIGVQYYDRETQQKEWTNYEAAIFAKAPAQVEFYKNVLVEGAIVELSGEQIKIRKFEGQNGLMLSLELINAKLGYAANPSQGQPAQQQTPAQRPQQAATQQMPAPQPQQNFTPDLDDGWSDDDIPFN